MHEAGRALRYLRSEFQNYAATCPVYREGQWPIISGLLSISHGFFGGMVKQLYLEVLKNFPWFFFGGLVEWPVIFGQSLRTFQAILKIGGAVAVDDRNPS